MRIKDLIADFNNRTFFDLRQRNIIVIIMFFMIPGFKIFPGIGIIPYTD